MAREKKAKYSNLAMVVSFEGPRGTEGYTHIKGWISTVDSSYLDLYSDGGKFKGVEFTSQADYRSLREKDQPLYSFGVQFNGDNKQLRELSRGVKVLTEIERKLNLIEDKYGPPASFGAWVQRLCEVIGLDKVRLANKECFIDPVIAASIIDGQVAFWKEATKENSYA